MLLTQESRRARWTILLAVWLVCGAVVGLHTAAVRDYVTMLNAIGATAETASAGTAPVALRQALPARYADAQMWVRHVLAAEEADVMRLRRTSADNAPQGREVHWSAGFSWLVRAAGAVQRALTADGWPLALERSVLWLNAPLLLGAMVLLSAWVAREAGAGGGVLVALAMVGHKRFYEGFAPAYADHHGLVTGAGFGLVLGIAFMGAGWWRPADARGTTESGATRLLPRSRESARNAAVVSALCGAVGLWISAAATLPAIALAGAAGLAATWWQGRAAQRSGAIFEPGLWRRWGRVGAAASGVFYLLEYAPSELGLRLEVNHPLYALAWWGGAEAIASLAEWRLRLANGAAASVRGLAGRLWLPTLAIAAVPVAILIGGTAVFLVADPFVGELRHFVAEGRTLIATVRQFGWGAVGYDLVSAVTILIIATVGFARSTASDRVVLATLLGITAGLAAMAIGEMRWWVTASGPQIALLLATVVVLTREPTRERRGTRWLLIAGVAGGLFLTPAAQRIARERSENARRAVAEGDLMQPLYRDIAAVLRATQPEGEIVLLASPNASAGIGYFGRFKTLGTLYWENAAGLRAAAKIFSAQTDDEAQRLIRERGVTHVAMLAQANFVGEYFKLLHPHSGDVEAKRSLGYRLMSAPLENLPRWLQPVPFRAAPELAGVARGAALFRVVHDQAEPERWLALAQTSLARGEVATAEQWLERALAAAPAGARAEFCEAAGAACYEFGADALAVRMFRRALSFDYDPGIATTAAWILATSSDAAVRNGRAALELIQPIAVRASDDATVLSTYAAACAEAGRFAEAVSAAERAITILRRSGDAEAVELLARRLEAYRAGKTWRQ